MDYLTNYYKNLSEQLNHKVKFLEKCIYEMQAQVSAAEPAQISDVQNVTTAVAPPSGSPSHSQNSPGAPTNPGEAPVRREGETDEQYGYRYEQWLRAKKRFETYQRWRSIEEKGGRVFSYPERMPMRKVTDGEGGTYLQANPPTRVGDVYIGQNGEVWRVNENQQWERV